MDLMDESWWAWLRESPGKSAIKDPFIHSPASCPLPKGKNVR